MSSCQSGGLYAINRLLLFRMTGKMCAASSLRQVAVKPDFLLPEFGVDGKGGGVQSRWPVLQRKVAPGSNRSRCHKILSHSMRNIVLLPMAGCSGA